MSMQEYDWYAHGFFIRNSMDHEAIRQVWLLLYNVHSRSPIQNAKHLSQVWPLYIDKLKKTEDSSVDKKISILKLLKAKMAKKDAELRFRRNNK